MNVIRSVLLFALLVTSPISLFAATKQAVKPPQLPPASKASQMFYTAASNFNYEMMDTYLGRGADINCQNCAILGTPPLAMALSKGAYFDLKLLQYLIAHGADVNLISKDLLSPLMQVIKHGFWDYYPDILLKSVPYLVESGADVKLVNSNGDNALFFLVRQGYGDAKTMKASMRIMRFLVDKGTDVNHQSKDGATALMHAARGCGIYTVRHLLYLRANPNLTNALGETALSIAEDTAAETKSGSSCNQVVGMLRNPEQSAIDPLELGEIIPTGSPSGIEKVIGTYGGTFDGDDEGIFQLDVNQDGTVTFNGHSNRSGVTFIHAGKVSNDGTSVIIGNAQVEFTGTINSEGVLSGTWKTQKNEQGKLQGNKGNKVEIPSTQIFKALGSLFGGSSK